MRLSFSILVVTSLWICLVQYPCTLHAQDLDQQIEAYLAEKIQVDRIPGLTAAIVKDGEVIYKGAFGVKNVGMEDELTTEHVFHLASVSKPFVASAIVILVEQGKLELDDQVVKHLPYFELADERYKDITIRQMLNHTSGMPDVQDYEWENPQLDEGAAERYVRQNASEKLLWGPGENWRYSNMAFDTLGDLIAKVSGMSFEAFMRTQIFAPLGMHQSSFIYPEIDEALRTTGHVDEPATVSEVYPYNRRHAPSSTLNSSVSQMTRWMIANLNRGAYNGARILQAESFDLLWTPTTTTSGRSEVGLSWFLYEYESHRVISHGGGDTGFRSYILLLPDDDIGIVLASNWQGTDSSEITFAMLDLVLAHQ